MARTKCLFLTGSFILLLAAGLSRSENTNTGIVASFTSSSSSSTSSSSSSSSSSSPSRDYGYFNSTSTLTISPSTWDMRLSKELTLRTCNPNGTLLSQRRAAGASPSSSSQFLAFRLELRNGTLVFEFERAAANGGGVVSSVTVGSFLADYQQYTVRLKMYLGAVYLNVSTLAAPALYSTVVANATFNSGLLTASIPSSELRVGEGFTGCLYAGPGVNFKGGNVAATNVSWNYCPLRPTLGCTSTDQNDCYTKPCLNGGTCEDMHQTYRCLCPRNFNGTNCETDLARRYGCDVSPCENNGTCTSQTVLPGELPYTCQCPEGWTGVNCETVLNQCEKMPPLCGQGTCQNIINSYSCNCTGTGFRGRNCSEDINECEEGQPCGASASCFNYPGFYSCQCPPGYNGPLCQDIDECLSTPCRHGGTCTQGINNYTCSCRGGYSGRNCEDNIDDCADVNCQGQFTECRDGVQSYSCECMAGYSNQTGVCTDINECASNPCRYGATCRDNINSYACDCVQGYEGTNCETDIDDCASQPCLNNATCADGVASFTCQCVLGFASDNCSVDIDDCAVNACSNGASCNDQVNGYTCTCVEGWTGPTCEENINDCASNLCDNNSTCNDLVASYNCTCRPGFTGIYCGTNIDDCDPDPCKNGAPCIDGDNDYTCNCPADKMGKNCSQVYDACSFEPCKNNATCSTVKPQHDYNCTCVTGFSGLNCSNNINDCVSNTCQSFQKCYDGINSYTCGCEFGYEGPRCEDEIDECASNPCQNGGSCNDHLGYYTCSCPSHGDFGKGRYLTGYTGVNCEEDVNECEHEPPICKNGGLCRNHNGSYSCFCLGLLPNGLLATGSNCQILTSYCMASGGNPCENGATCVNKKSGYQCVCVPGYTGKNCSIDIDECASNPCDYNGTCTDRVNGYTCQCIAGITGVNCTQNIDDCLSNPCGHGICDDQINSYVCNCTDSGFTGVNCENNINDCLSHNCTNNSTCRDGIKEFTCECQAGYTGRACEIDIQECASSPCNNGTCLEYSNQALYGLGDPSFTTFSYSNAAGYLCRCIPGFEGPHCRINIDECETAACENNATCRDGINNFTCECAPGFKDQLCQTEIDECEVYKACQHSSRCIDKKADYECQCIEFDPAQPSGNYYGGKNCSIRLSGCDQGSQCENGQCIPTLVGPPLRHRYRCLCQSGFTGFYCDVSTTMTFTSNGSMVTFSPKAEQRARPSLSFRFRTTLRDAVLAVYSLSSSTFVSVEVVSGRLVALYRDSASSLTQTETLDTQEHVNNADWNHLVLNLQNNISLSLLSGACGTERCTQHFTYPSPKPDSSAFTKVSFGKFDSSLLALTMTKSVFFGCLEDVLFDDMVTLYPGQRYGMYRDTLQQCPRSEQCDPYTCHQHGDCVDLWDTFRCVCDRPYWGATCQHNYTAATFSKDGIPSVATFDVSTLTFSAGLNLSMFLWTRQKNSTLITYLTDESSSTFLTLEMHNGSLASRLQLCGTSAFFHQSPEPIDSGSSNFVSLSVQGGQFTLTVNETVQVNTTFSDQPACPLTATRAYFGTRPPTAGSGGRRRRQADVVSSLSSLNGVLQDVELQGSKLDFEARDGSNSTPYIVMLQSASNVTLGALSTLSACNTTTPCLNEGVCSDEFFNDFQCDCQEGYLGKDCSQPDFCKDNSCPSSSECRSLQLGFECISVGQFDGRSSYTSYTPHLPEGLPAQTISFKMRTRAVYGAIFETRDLNNFIKVRVRDGSLEVNYMLKESGFSDSLRMHMPINDGRWYDVEVTVNENNAMRMRVLHNGTIVQEHPPNEPQPLGDTVANLTSLVAGVSQGAGSILVGKTSGRPRSRTEQAFKGCLEEVRLGGILLPFISDSQMNNNIDTIARFQLATMRSVQEGCQSRDACLGHLCHSRATCQDTWNDYSCQCPPGFSGQYCTRQVSWCAGDLCYNGGTCEEHSGSYSCTCAAGYKGTRCETQKAACDNSSCANGSTCFEDVSLVQQYRCNCTDAAYIGDLCSILKENKSCADNLCQNGATCTSTQDGFNCSCAPGYSGPHCGLAINYCRYDSCQNGVTCYNQSNLQNFSCVCLQGYTGDLCETTIQECNTTTPPCFNGGTCDDGIASISCLCPPGWEGDYCQHDIDECNVSNPCQYGNCTNLVPGYECDCTNTGYSGKNCSVEINECDKDFCVKETSLNCTDLEGNYRCNCMLGYEGKNCSAANCSIMGLCKNNSTCSIEPSPWGTQWQCACPEYYGGKQCELAGPCASNPCNNSIDNTADCIQNSSVFNTTNPSAGNFTCVCNLGWAGQTCSEDVNECLITGICHNGNCTNLEGGYKCNCDPGYSGVNCTKDINECESDPCLHGGSCTHSIDIFTCNCSGTGYKGTVCSVDVDECNELLPAPCNNGTCKNENGSFTCDCDGDYLGELCQYRNHCLSTVCSNGGTCNHTWAAEKGDYEATCHCINGFMGERCLQSPQTGDDDGIDIALIIGPIVGVILLIIIIGVIIFIVVARDKRATRGAYSPSRQETAGARVELGNVLKKPPEERLI